MFACSFEAAYGGNFIKMLCALGNRLRKDYDAKVYFVFPKQPQKEWLDELSQVFPVGYTRKPYERSAPDFCRMLREWEIDIVHTHFEAYDVPVAKAVRKLRKKVKMVWHLHDYITLDKANLNLKFVRKVGTHLRFWYHWGWMGKEAYFLPVSKEVGVIENHYRRHIFTFPPEKQSVAQLERYELIRGEVVLNGIDVGRIGRSKEIKFPHGDGLFHFLSFGGHAIGKGIPTILDAADRLHEQGEKFCVLITKGVGTEVYVRSRYGRIPSYVRLEEQVEDVNGLFAKSHCFISASLAETMSMAIAEASIYGLPVIQSDIPGTWWNAHNASTFLFHVGDATDLAAKMKEVLHADKVSLSEKCRESAACNLKELSMETWTKRVIDVYKKI